MKYLNDAGGRYKLPLKSDEGKTLCTLLWGDPLQEIAREGSGAAERVKVRARKRTGWVPASAVSDSGLLEIYVIDVGQGDGVLMRTPHDDAWHMIDAGIRASQQMTRKGAANFVRWKFIDDLRRDKVTLKNMVVTHPDADHYGGMIDLLSGALPDGRSFGIEVQNFWHCGIGRFKDGDKLGALRFAKQYSQSFRNENLGRPNDRDRTAPHCTESFVDAQGLPARAVICLRAYRKMEGVHDLSVLLTAVDHPTQGLLGRFDARGVSFDAALQLARHFIQGYGRKGVAR